MTGIPITYPYVSCRKSTVSYTAQTRSKTPSQCCAERCRALLGKLYVYHSALQASLRYGQIKRVDQILA